MSMYWKNDDCTLYHGDCLEVLRAMSDDSVHTVVTSPPYFALRSYLPKGHPDKAKEIGSEPTPEAFIQTMVDVFREVRRVLRPDGVCWINLGDSYAGTGKTGGGQQGANAEEYRADSPTGKGTYHSATRGVESGNLQNIPHRVAEALRQDGWIWRQTIVWAKKSPMPESVGGWRWMRCRVKVTESGRGGNGYARMMANDTPSNVGGSLCPGCPKCIPNNGYVLRRGAGRCTTAHEYLFLATKAGKYFWDGEASKEEQSTGTHERFGKNGKPSIGCPKESPAGSGVSNNESYAAARKNMIIGGRNPRSVWTISSEPTSFRHFATYPSELVRRCLASAPVRVCPHCGAPWAPVVASPNLDPERHIALTTCSGYRPTCSCPAHEPIGGTVLDPFAGIGTTGQTARHLGMQFVGIDLNKEYLEHAKERILSPPRWWLRKQAKAKNGKRVKPMLTQGVLFQ